MTKAKNGDTVLVHYTGKLTNGEVFDSSVKSEPLKFTIGSGNLIQEFEQAVVGLRVGESITKEITSENAYGNYRKELVINVDKKDIPEGIHLEKDKFVQIPQSNGNSYYAIVKDIKDSKVVFDANPPLAGKDLVFDIVLVEILE
ncbi:MAG: peptidylprolyl isomerase [Candidatus Margulisbacteria bacterium GWF2_35_9]|nr:MAG: peptidylprolyl isomerase [Candidatus Margulisbacteria bacterium GWF2_35_9]